MPLVNTNPIPINVVTKPALPWSDDNFGGPYPRNGNLYALSQDVIGTHSPPRPWKSTDKGATWTALPVETTLTWGQFVYYWNPLVASNLITVMAIFSASSTALVDFDLDTETWGTPYATSGGPQIFLGNKSFVTLGKLSNGTVKAFYISNDLSNGLDYAEANIAGSGNWDTAGTPVLPISFFRDARIFLSLSRNVAVDSSDRCRCIVSQQGASPILFDYFDLDSSNVVGSTVSLSTPNNSTRIKSIRVFPDGKIYAPGTGSGIDKVFCWVGTSAIPPVFTREQVADLTTDPNTTAPGFPVVSYIGGKPTVVWDTRYASGEDTIGISQRDPLTNTWSAWQIYLDLDVNFPQPPIVKRFSTWTCEGLSITPVNSSTIGVLVEFDTDTPNRGQIAFYTAADLGGKKRGHAF